MLPADGVLEHTDWACDIEQDLDRNLTRLANLAQDDHHRDPNYTAQEHYHKRLVRILKNQAYSSPLDGEGNATLSNDEKLATIRAAKSIITDLNIKIDELSVLIGDLTVKRDRGTGVDKHAEGIREL